VGFENPPVPWHELERVLSDRPAAPAGRRSHVPPGANGGDSPAWSPRRADYEPPARLVRGASATPYAELHCHSNFSFLDGASHPEELVEEATRLGLEALAITDHDGLYGVVRFAEAARAVGLPTVFGAELSLDLSAPQNGEADPEGRHLLVLARSPGGYAQLSSVLSAGHLAGGEKGKPDYSGVDWSARGREWLVLTGCRKSAVPRALVDEGPSAAARELAGLVDVFGRDNVAVELCNQGDPLDTVRNDVLVRLADAAGVPYVATNNVHYATPSRQRLATALAAVRARRSLDDLQGWLPATPAAHLRSGDEQLRWFERWPGAVERAAQLGKECAFDLRLVAPELPPFDCPAGYESEMAYLRHLVELGATERYGPRGSERVPRAWHTIDHELAVIEQLRYPGYFLVVWEIVRFCKDNQIYCQGRGSAANSAVCYALGITNVDSVKLGLLFERFLSSERDGPPDIDIDIESGEQRELVIQHVYERYDRQHTAQVANVISYRARSAVRDMAKALGHSTGQQDAWSKQMDMWGSVSTAASGGGHDIPAPVLELAREVEHMPRHLGIHSGGMVICDRPIVEVCPVEWARMANRTVLQWDKDDCASVGLVKFDLLGLGMLAVLHGTIDMIRSWEGIALSLDGIPTEDDEVYDMLGRADSIGVFQVESRAQMATLPRLKPHKFYDLVVEVALIRPGPIQGGSVHPYIRRRQDLEKPTYLHPSMERALKKTLGVPLFQEQLMQIAMDTAGFSPAEADQLRQAMASKRSHERMERLRQRFFDGLAGKGIAEEEADHIWAKLVAFASYGFPESHSVSFAYLVYASSWLKRYYPAAFCAGLLNAQPMGFYSPHTLTQDARRHGVEVRTPDLNASGETAGLESPAGPGKAGPGAERAASTASAGVAGVAGDEPALEPVPRAPHTPRGAAPAGTPWAEWGVGGPAVRLGLAGVRGVGDELAERIVAERDAGGAFADPHDLARRVPDMTAAQLEALATAGAFGCFGLDRRAALWVAGAVAGVRADRLDGIVTGIDAPPLPGMQADEEARADLWATGVSPDGHPTRFLRPELDERGVVPAAGLTERPHGSRVTVGGVVTHRQRPATAGGTMFVNLEDETGLINVVVSRGCWLHHRRVVRSAPALLVRGRLERVDDVTNVIAERIEHLPVDTSLRSRDFR
jgi:error-prone DNA polymerase